MPWTPYYANSLVLIPLKYKPATFFSLRRKSKILLEHKLHIHSYVTRHVKICCTYCYCVGSVHETVEIWNSTVASRNWSFTISDQSLSSSKIESRWQHGMHYDTSEQWRRFCFRRTVAIDNASKYWHCQRCPTFGNAEMAAMLVIVPNIFYRWACKKLAGDI